MAERGWPEVYVVFKDGDSHGTDDGTPLCVSLSEREARHRKVGHCVRYVAADGFDAMLNAAREEGRMEIERLHERLRSAEGAYDNPIFED